MKAIIMAGGFGTRLRPLTSNIPKPMVPIGNLPMMQHVVHLLRNHGFDEIVSVLFFQSDIIKNYFRDGSRFGVKMDYVQPDQDYGTAGAVRCAVDFCDDTVLIISGDVLTDFDLGKAFNTHRERGANASILLTHMENPLSYGIVITDQEERITRFMEKPSWGEMFSDTINTGVYILEPDTVRLIPPATNFDFSQNLFPVMLQKKMKLYGNIVDGYWKDVGNIDEYFNAHRDILQDKIRLEYNARIIEKDGSRLLIGDDVSLPDSIELQGTVMIGHNCTIGDGVKLANSVIGDNTVIDPEANITDSIIWSDSTIGRVALISNATVNRRVTIGDRASVLDRAVVSDDCRIGQGATVRANVKIWPGKIVDDGAVVSSTMVWGEQWNRELFSDAKVSGLALTEITPEMAVRLGAAFGALLGREQRIVTSRDASDVTRLLKRTLMCGLMAVGIDVDDLEILPTPILRHALKNGKYGAGIYIRHNPLNYNVADIIFFDHSGLDLPTSKSKKVERHFSTEDFERASLAETGKVEIKEEIPYAYRQDFLGSIDRDQIQNAAFKLVIDYSYGSAGQFFPDITGELNIDALSINAYPNPRKASDHSHRLDEYTTRLSKIAASLSADLGIMINSAAEKMIVVDETGTEIDAQLLLLMMTDLYLRSYPAKRIAVPVAASMGTEQIAEQYGVEVIRVRNDHLAMMDAHLRGGADFVGGTRGGFIFPGFQIGADAMYAAVMLLQMLAKNRITLGSLRPKLDVYRRRSTSVPCPWGKKGQVMRTLITSTEDKRRQLIDGVRVFEDGGWVLVAPDRQHASFEILAEARSEGEVEKILSAYTRLVEESQN